MPVDPQEHAAGNVELLADGTARVVGAREMEDGQPRFISHFVTCPHAAQHRARKRGSP